MSQPDDSISPVPADPPPAPPSEPATIPTDWSADHKENQYWGSGTDVDIERAEGILQTPLCEDPGVFGQGNAPPCGIVQMHAPIGKKIVRFTASRANAQPKAPIPTPGSDNEVLESVTVKNLNPIISDGKTRIFRVMTTAVYALRVVPDTQTGYPGARGPFDNASPEVYNLNSGDFDNNAVAAT